MPMKDDQGRTAPQLRGLAAAQDGIAKVERAGAEAARKNAMGHPLGSSARKSWENVALEHDRKAADAEHAAGMYRATADSLGRAGK